MTRPDLARQWAAGSWGPECADEPQVTVTVTISGGQYTEVRTMPLPDGRVLRVTSDVTPGPGTIVADPGHGVTIAERLPPARPGAAWVAPYAVNCAVHGWVTSRSTLGQARGEAEAHISEHHPDAAS